MEAFTARNAVKYVAKTIIASKTAEVAATTIADHTQFEEDDIAVKLSSGLIGWYVADKLKPVSDAVVDKAADKIAELRANRAAKKTTK